MDDKEFRRTLELFPVVRSRDYCAESGSSSKETTQQAQAQAESGSSSKETTQQAQAQEAKGANKKESSGTEGYWQIFIPLILILPMLQQATQPVIGIYHYILMLEPHVRILCHYHNNNKVWPSRFIPVHMNPCELAHDPTSLISLRPCYIGCLC
ncbi:hypothetical protein ABZP36_000571 [Zizania latifolia]